MSKKISMTQFDLFVIMILTSLISVLVYQHNIIGNVLEYLRN